MAIKEQRVYGNWYDLSYLRCTLLGFERNRLIKIPSNQIMPIRNYTVSSNPNPDTSIIMLPWFVTGFTLFFFFFCLNQLLNTAKEKKISRRMFHYYRLFFFDVISEKLLSLRDEPHRGSSQRVSPSGLFGPPLSLRERGAYKKN